MTTTRRKIAFNMVFLGSSQALTWLLSAVYVLVIPAYLGPANMGILALAIAVSGYVNTLASLGIPVFLLKEVARNHPASQNLVGATMTLCTSLSVVLWGVVLTALHLSGQPLVTILVVYMFAGSSVLQMIQTPLYYTLQGLDKMHYSLYNALAGKGVATGLALGLVVVGGDIVLVSATTLLSNVLLTGLYWQWFNRHSQTRLSWDWSLYKRLSRGGFSFLLMDISQTTYLYLDSFLLALLVSQEIVGYYNVPFRLIGTLLFVPMAICQAMLPTLSRLATEAQDTLNAIGRTTLSFLICLSLPVAVGCTVLADPLLTFFYRGKFGPSIPILLILGWTIIPIYIGMCLYQILTAQDQQARWTKLTIMSILVNLGLNLMLIPYFQQTAGNGGIGAAFSLLLTEILVASCGSWLVGRRIINRQLGRDVLKSGLAAGLMALAIWPLREMFILVPVLTGVVVYGLLVVAFGLIPAQYRLAAFGLAGRLKHKLLAGAGGR